jgi:GntR family transcriptional regulator
VIVHVDPGSPVPPFEQIRVQVTSMVRVGVLAPGTRLPPIRQLAKDLGLAGGTVARAYRELESDGVVATHGRHGTVVQRPPRGRPAPGAEALDRAAAAYATEARRLGAGEAEAVVAVRAAFADLDATERSA